MTQARESLLDILSQQVRGEIDHWIVKYPADKKQSAVMAALRIVQDDNKGFLDTQLMNAVAEYLEMPRIAVYEVATFYSMYEHKPVGRHKICVCNSISCLLNGSVEILEHLQERLGVKLGEVTVDGKFSIKEVECLGACVGAPAMMIGNQYYEKLTPERIDKILAELE
ncbi:MAG TPA: NADH-quinone oxidoreductase subunit NuoE [Gammaproteobacteria bacterium]|nr:NADH-quinone oxidoreductase subunit NuoE [Gammaproteobacteria bacterium]